MAIDVKSGPLPREMTVSKSRAWDWLTKKGRGGDSGDAPSLPGEGPPKFPDLPGVVTDHRLLTELSKLKGEESYPIATDTFLGKSKDQYNSAWLTRELVQNFVDHNPAHPGTLNGVRFSVQELLTGVKRIEIQGDWPFSDPTGVLSPHSDKPEGVNTAGGNGIGLKQTAIRLLRDFGVDKFEIHGEGWTVGYGLAKKEVVNHELAERGAAHQVRHDWLVGQMKESNQKGQSGYVIETSNPVLVQAIEQFNTLGVSSENPYLQNPDYISEAGAIKWLPKAPTGEIAKGRLFINGQVMNYGVNGPSELDYWVGPEGVTIQLNNTVYAMNIDRPPVEPWRLKQYTSKLVEGMSKDVLIDQLRRSEHLWAGSAGGSLFSRETPGSFVVIEAMVDRLSTPSVGLKPEDMSKVFGEKNLLALDIKLDEGQIKNLEAQGYTICPGYFSRVGFEKASSKLESVDLASTQAPDMSANSRASMAEKFGLQVAFETFPEAKTPEGFFALVGEKLKPVVTKIEYREGRDATIRLELPKDIITPQLLANPLFNQKNEQQKLLYFIRGMAFYGLQKGLFNKIYLSQGEVVTTFKTDYDPSSEEDVLFTRNNKGESSSPFIEIDFSEGFSDKFKDIYSRPVVAEGDVSGRQGEGVGPVVGEPVPVIDSGRPITVPVSPVGTPTQGGEVKTAIPAEDPNKTAGAPLEGPFVGEVPTEVNRSAPWSEEDQKLWLLARGKNEESYTAEERAVMVKHQALAEKVAKIGIEQPEGPERSVGGQVIEREAVLSEAERDRLAQLEEAIPGIAGLVDELEKNVPRQRIEESVEKNEHEKYLEWRESGDFYGRLGQEADYLTGRTLIDLLNENSQAAIDVIENTSTDLDPKQSALSLLQARLKSVVDRLAPEGDVVNDFEIVVSPQGRELAQLGLLKTFVEIATGMEVRNDLFLYEGTGVRGINLSQKAIGLHRALTKAGFGEALGTFGHEVAHNVPEAEDHGIEFRHAMQSIFTTTIEKFADISGRALEGEPLSGEERVLLDIRKQWESLRAA